MTGAYTNFENFARLNSADPALNQHASVQKGIARSIGEFDETKSLFGAEPFDDTADRWTGGASKGAWLNRGRVPKPRGCELYVSVSNSRRRE